MTFELWLYTIKKLGQTYDMAKSAYERLTAEEQERLKEEFSKYSK